MYVHNENPTVTVSQRRGWESWSFCRPSGWMSSSSNLATKGWRNKQIISLCWNSEEVSLNSNKEMLLQHRATRSCQQEWWKAGRERRFFLCDFVWPTIRRSNPDTEWVFPLQIFLSKSGTEMLSSWNSVDARDSQVDNNQD